ncbi:hypothetical protein [Sulfurimonas microaerophilic]|uniref:hypothetical protein n=1 Tax=Sulfurimonas microaerophilic TaxID=3058392 RepID=UPI002714E1B6|nr:hypothetical protein [Sulfurimonas sp. hsl 1-7]
MRKASAALVPLLIAIMTLFWFIMIIGGSDDNLHTINNVSKLQKVQEKLLISSVKYRYKIEAEAKEQNATLSEAQVNQNVDAYVEYIMVKNKIENGGG